MLPKQSEVSELPNELQPKQMLLDGKVMKVKRVTGLWVRV